MWRLRHNMSYFEYLKTHRISPAIIDIIETTRKHCYLVTPYIKPWPVLERTFNKASESGTRITVILRAEQNSRQVGRRLNDSYGFEVIVLERLHTKLYLNEQCALIGSMNLYDSSNERNYELAIHTSHPSFVRELREEVVQQDLLALDPVEHLQGSFHEEEVVRRRVMEAFERDLDNRGFCVTCGTKIEFDRAGLVRTPRIVRCRPCWAKAPYIAEEYRWPISYCHYCGGDFDSVLVEPSHHACRVKLEEYNEIRD